MFLSIRDESGTLEVFFEGPGSVHLLSVTQRAEDVGRDDPYLS
jgi:hypothetical protein